MGQQPGGICHPDNHFGKKELSLLRQSLSCGQYVGDLFPAGHQQAHDVNPRDHLNDIIARYHKKATHEELLNIDAAGFQNLCDTYLSLRETEYRSYNRTGSQLGKQKPLREHPILSYAFQITDWLALNIQPKQMIWYPR